MNELTSKQRAAIAKASSRNRELLRRQFKGQNVGRKGQQARKGGKVKENAGCFHSAFDAFHPNHLALPRITAPYTVIKTTTLIDTSSDTSREFRMFGPLYHQDAGLWVSTCMMGNYLPLTSYMDAQEFWKSHKFPQLSESSWKSAQIAPAAFSIQIMNPESLLNTTGMVIAGRCKTGIDLTKIDLGKFGHEFVDNLVGYSSPRFLPAAKLATSPVQVDCLPSNMSALADINSFEEGSQLAFTMTPNARANFTGFNPIFVYNPSNIALQFLVTCEWRVRFDPSTPAYAACTLHPPATESLWASAMRAGLALGHGVLDITHVVGTLAARAGRMRSAGSSMLALTG